MTDLIETFMELTGESRSSVEKKLQTIFAEFQQKIESKNTRNTAKGKKPQYTQKIYPHYLPANVIQQYTLRITLRGIKPAIWRKIEVPSNITLRHLGDLIIDLMGWDNYHLNQYHKGNDFFMPFYQREVSDEDAFMWNCNNYNQEDYTIANLLQKKTQTVTFEYDFGDSWAHEIRLSSIDEYAPNTLRQINFIGGNRACPPEDCGGIWGYEDLMNILSKYKKGNRLSSEERESLEWAGWDKNYNPEYLDLDRCKAIVMRYNK